MADAGKISSRGTKDILAIMWTVGGVPERIAEEKSLLQKSDESELLVMVQKIITENEKVAIEYKAGKTALLMFFVGQGMKASGGSANPAVLKKLFERELTK